MRVTKEMLREKVTYLNKIAGTKEGNRYIIGYAYGQPRLEKECGAGVKDISPRGTAGEINAYLTAYIAGYETAKREA